MQSPVPSGAGRGLRASLLRDIRTQDGSAWQTGCKPGEVPLTQTRFVEKGREGRKGVPAVGPSTTIAYLSFPPASYCTYSQEQTPALK